jgi:hypothetical protein
MAGKIKSRGAGPAHFVNDKEDLMNHRSRYTITLGTVAILVALTLLPHNAAATSQNQVDRIEELEARLAVLETAAGAPTVVTYQGYLTDAGSSPLDGQVNLLFSIYDSDSSGSPLWSEEHGAVEVTNGYFTVLLGDEGSPLTASTFSGTGRWMQVEVEVDANGSGYTNLPRQQIASVPFALQSQKAASAPWSGLTGIPAGFADDVDNNTTYSAGDGLDLGGTTFSVDVTDLLGTGLTESGNNLAVDFAGSGSASTAARSDHTHSMLQGNGVRAQAFYNDAMGDSWTVLTGIPTCSVILVSVATSRRDTTGIHSETFALVRGSSGGSAEHIISADGCLTCKVSSSGHLVVARECGVETYWVAFSVVYPTSAGTCEGGDG